MVTATKAGIEALRTEQQADRDLADEWSAAGRLTDQGSGDDLGEEHGHDWYEGEEEEKEDDEEVEDEEGKGPARKRGGCGDGGYVVMKAMRPGRVLVHGLAAAGPDDLDDAAPTQESFCSVNSDDTIIMVNSDERVKEEKLRKEALRTEQREAPSSPGPYGDVGAAARRLLHGLAAAEDGRKAEWRHGGWRKMVEVPSSPRTSSDVGMTAAEDEDRRDLCLKPDESYHPSARPYGLAPLPPAPETLTAEEYKKAYGPYESPGEVLRLDKVMPRKEPHAERFQEDMAAVYATLTKSHWSRSDTEDTIGKCQGDWNS
jgi:hypothetical protein